MKKYIGKILWILLVITAISHNIYATDFTTYTNEQLDKLPEIQAPQDIIPSFDFRDSAKDVAKGEFTWDVTSILNGLFTILGGELRRNLMIIIEIFVLVILSSFVTNLENSFTGEASKVGFYVCYFLILCSILKGFSIMCVTAINTIESLSIFMHALFPVAISLVATSGGVVSAAALAPTLMATMQIIIIAIRDFFVPILVTSFAVKVADGVTEGFTLRPIADFMQGIIKWGLSFLMTIFIGVSALQNLGVKPLDSVASRGVKFAIGSFVPVVGGMLSDAFDLVITSAGVIKNAVGVVGIIAIVLMTLSPLIKLLIQSFLFKGGSALLAPIADSKITRILSDVGDVFTLLAVMILCTMVLFIVSIGIIISGAKSI